jgi:hypothetical protein
LLCLKNVRELLNIDSHYLWANTAWDGAHHKVRTTNQHRIPYGAPVFSDRPGGSKFGHVMLAGGRFPNGQRILWTNDERWDGRITPVTFAFITGHWGHKIKGFTRDLNGTGIPYLLDGKGL